MSTELKSYTIVPDSLYVERKADKQLHDIVEAMQRPGYVLVSRQMGKTNLLLRAKRKWENSEDLYVYVDMTNVDETEKECFESLIDIAIDTHEQELASVRERIMDLRRVNILKSPVQAHNEELRVLLSAVKGKLVFILDEIDSLTRTSFSDNVFSQIRSVYFSRVNYPVLDKLTYVLSGVVEPTEIIKNPKISPFNIGEKILLDDFSREEYMTFLSKAGLLKFGDSVIDRIYYWASGNPRITWDICYELQNKDNLTPEDVDVLVKAMYLTSFDKAPVDTIRTLVKEDRILREAIIQLAYRKGDVLSDKIKSKLYLSGIVNYDASEVKIKNKIINESLSMDWLQKVEEEDKGLLKYAVELCTKGLYRESIDKFLKYLKGNVFPDLEAPYYCYYLGSCYYHVRDFEESLKYLNCNPLDYNKAPDEFRHENLLSGVDCINIGQYTQSIDYLTKVMDCKERDWIYYSAKLNALTARLQVTEADIRGQQEIENEYLQLAESNDEAVNNDVKMYAAFQLARLYGRERAQDAFKVYDKAMGFVNELVKPRILVEKYNIATEAQRPSIMNQLLGSLKSISSVTTSLDPDKSLELDEELFKHILCLVYVYAPDRWEEVRDKYQLLPYTYGDFLVHLFSQAFVSPILYGKGSSRLIREIHDNLGSDSYNVSPDSFLLVYKFNAFLNFTEEFAKEYLNAFQATDDTIDSFGLIVVRSYAWALMERKEYSTIVSELEWIVDRYPNKSSHQEMVIRAFYEYTLLISTFRLSDKKSAMSYSKLILSYIDEEIDQATDKNKDNLTQVKEAAQWILSEVSPREPVHSVKTPGRNDKVKVRYLQSNQVVEKKYKTVENDLKRGICIIVDEK